LGWWEFAIGNGSGLSYEVSFTSSQPIPAKFAQGPNILKLQPVFADEHRPYSIMAQKSHPLPPELWPSIASFLPQSSLTSLSLTCSNLLVLIRPLLFHSVSLVTGDSRCSNASETLNLLSRDKTLAASVVESKLRRSSVERFSIERTVTPAQEKAVVNLVNPTAFKNLIHLRRLEITSWIWWNEDERHYLERWLENQPTIEEFSYWASYGSMSAWTSDGFQGIRRLKNLTWKSLGGPCTFNFLWYIPGLDAFMDPRCRRF
jgi:hypothetical protein